jgi:hypothetical protein
MSKDLMCYFCHAQTTPTRDGGEQRITYRFYSFGSRANELSGCQKLHASKLQETIEILQNATERVAIRVGVDPMFAILINDANGNIRFSALGVTVLPNQSEIARFNQASQAILATDPNPTTGKIIHSQLEKQSLY